MNRPTRKYSATSILLGVCIVLLALMTVLMLSLSSRALAQENVSSIYRTIVWRERPIAISLVPGKEKILSFTEDVKWGIPTSLVGIVSGESVAGQVFLTAQTPFENQRFRFYGIDSNRYYIFDITASERGDETPLQILYQGREGSKSNSSEHTAPPAASNIVELTRFAFQSIYSPARLIQPLPDVSSIRLKERTHKHHLVTGEDVIVEPIAQWRTDAGLYAVALHLQNVSTRRVELDPRQIRRDDRWRTFALYNPQLQPANEAGDSTTAVIIADGAWEDVSTWLH